MTRPQLVPIAALSLLAGTSVLAPRASADTITRVDGTRIEDVEIVSESLTQVRYSKDRDQETIPSAEVLSIEYERKPKPLVEADGAELDGEVGTALDLLERYVAEFAESGEPERRYPWAHAHAAWRALGIYRNLGDLQGIVDAADRLIRLFPDSRYVPRAHLAKASALRQSGDLEAARSALDTFRTLIEAVGLSERWQLECRLAQVVLDPELEGEPKRETLEKVASEAGSKYPTVRSQAWVAQGESYLAQALAAQESGDAARKETVTPLLQSAREVFESITEGSRGDDETLAGAWTGLGDCLYQLGAGGSDQELLLEAAESYLRVVVLYGDQTRYSTKSMFFAGRCFDLLSQRDRSRKLYERVCGTYPESRWCGEARKYL